MFKEGYYNNLVKILGEPILAKRVAEYIIDTGILSQFRWIKEARYKCLKYAGASQLPSPNRARPI